MKPTLAVALRAEGGEIEAAEALDVDIYDVIGDHWGEGVTAGHVLDKLRAAKSAKTINVRINSVGGVVYDGLAIYNLLHSNKARVVVEIDGVAASAASLIAMAGDEIRMAENALMMVHNPWTLMMGEASELRVEADKLDKMRDALASTYEARTGLSREDIVRMMDEETWMTAAEAVDLGFATHVTAAKQAAAMLKSDLDLSPFKRVPVEAAIRDRGVTVLPTITLNVTGAESKDLAQKIRGEVEKALEQKDMAAARDTIDLEVKLIDSASAPAEKIRAALDAIASHPLRDLVIAETAQDFAAAVAAGIAKTQPAEPATENQGVIPDMSNTTLAHALGLPVGASETDVLAAAARMRELEVQICAIANVQSASEALGAVRGLKASADENEKTKAELVKVKAERDRQNFDALIARGQSAPVKLTPATAKLELERFEAAAATGRGADAVSALKAYLDVAPTILVSTPAKQPASTTGSAGQSLAYNGKTYDELKPREKHALWQSDPDLFRAMKDQHDAQVGV